MPKQKNLSMRDKIEGRFALIKIPQDIAYTNPEEVIKAFKGCLIVDCQLVNETFEYIIMGEQFNKIKDGSEPFGYVAVFRSTNIGSTRKPLLNYKFKGFVKIES